MIVDSLAGLRAMRAQLSALLLAHGVDGDTIADVEIASTELVTNGLTHAGAPAVAVRTLVEPHRIEMHVHHPDPTSPMPRPSVLREYGGRGLRIVDEVSDGVAIRRADGHRSTSLVFGRVGPDDPTLELLRPTVGA